VPLVVPPTFARRSRLVPDTGYAWSSQSPRSSQSPQSKRTRNSGLWRLGRLCRLRRLGSGRYPCPVTGAGRQTLLRDWWFV